MNGIDEFRYEIPYSLKDTCQECWEEKATHWGLCPSCYWKRELDSERIAEVWDYEEVFEDGHS